MTELLETIRKRCWATYIWLVNYFCQLFPTLRLGMTQG